MADTVPNPFQDAGSGPWNDFQGQKQVAPSDGPWADFAASSPAHGPWDDFSGTNETVMSKTAGGPGPSVPPSSFKTAPSSGGIDPQRFDRFLNGVYRGYAGTEQLLSRGLSYAAPETGKAWAKGADRRAQQLEDEGQEQAKYAGVKPGSTDWWNVAGQVASPINYAGGEGAVAGARALPLLGRIVEGSNIAKGALQGTAIAAAQPVTGADQKDYGAAKLGQLETGAITGGIAAPVISGIGSVVKPAFDKATQAALDAGAKLTPGQILGGPANWLERQTGHYFPFAGPMIRSARREGQDALDSVPAGAAEKPVQAVSPAPVQPSRPISESGQEYVQQASGTPSSIVTPDGSMEVPATPRLVELSDLKYANGNLQPRDRTRTEYIQGARERANRLDPQQLQPARVSDSGAPIVLDDGTILSGNGRTISIAEAYNNPQFKAQADAYRASLGPAAANMKKPVLVMQTSMEPEAAAKFADLSNRTRIDAMSATERAARDARALGNDISLYQGGDFDSPANAPFVKSFISRAVSPAELPSISKNGQLTKEGVDRMRSAVLGAAYDDAPLLSRLLESTDDNIRGITGALSDVAPKISSLRQGEASGRVMEGMDPSRDLQNAVRFISDLRDRGMTPKAYFAQGQMFGGDISPGAENWVRALYSDDLAKQLSRKNIKGIIDAYTEEAAKHQPGGFFPDETTSADVLKIARKQALGGEAPEFIEPSAPSSAPIETPSPLPPSQGVRGQAGPSNSADQRLPPPEPAKPAPAPMPNKENGASVEDRLLLHAMGHILPHLLGYSAIGPGALAPTAALAALYSGPGQAFARAMLTARPAGSQAVRDILKRYAPQAAGRLPLTSQGQQK